MRLALIRGSRRWLVWRAAALLVLAGCGALAEPTPTATPSPTATPAPTSTPMPTATVTSAIPTSEPTTEDPGEPIVLPMKGDSDAPVTIVEFSDYL